jgi:hypothetical protein
VSIERVDFDCVDCVDSSGVDFDPPAEFDPDFDYRVDFLNSLQIGLKIVDGKARLVVGFKGVNDVRESVKISPEGLALLTHREYNTQDLLDSVLQITS